MTKKGPLSKVEKFYIQERYKEEGIDTLAKELDRPKASIKRHITKCKDGENEKIENQFTVGAQFATSNGAVIMTQNASEMSDAVRGTTRNITSREAKCVTTTNKKNE
jgi:hypothetical protein